jgi:hypothetical protein
MVLAAALSASFYRADDCGKRADEDQTESRHAYAYNSNINLVNRPQDDVRLLPCDIARSAESNERSEAEDGYNCNTVDMLAESQVV